MDREAENHGEHVTPDCRYCSSALRRHQNGWFCISNEYPCRHRPLSLETTPQDKVAGRTYPSTPVSGDAVSDGCPSITMEDVQDGDPGDQMDFEQSNDGDQHDHEQRHDHFSELRSSANGTQGSRPSAAQDSAVEVEASHGEEAGPSEGDEQTDIDGIDEEVPRDETLSWVDKRHMVGKARQSDVVQVLESVNDLVVAFPVVAFDIEQELEMSDDEDMEG